VSFGKRYGRENDHAGGSVQARSGGVAGRVSTITLFSDAPSHLHLAAYGIVNGYRGNGKGHTRKRTKDTEKDAGEKGDPQMSVPGAMLEIGRNLKEGHDHPAPVGRERTAAQKPQFHQPHRKLFCPHRSLDGPGQTLAQREDGDEVGSRCSARGGERLPPHSWSRTPRSTHPGPQPTSNQTCSHGQSRVMNLSTNRFSTIAGTSPVRRGYMRSALALVEAPTPSLRIRQTSLWRSEVVWQARLAGCKLHFTDFV